MNTQSRFGEAAVSDEQLVQLLDGQLSVDDASAVRDRMAEDPASLARMDQLRRRGETLSDMLATVALTDAELNAVAAAISHGMKAAQSRRRRRPRVALLRAAAAIAAITALATVVPQVRAWIADSVLSVLHTLRPAGAPQSAATEPRTDGAADMRVTFTAAGGTFRLVIGDPAGTLILRAAGDATGSAELTNARDAHLVVSTAGVRVDGRLSTNAVIVLTLPASVRDVVVSDRTRNVLVPMPAAGEDTTLELLLLLR